LLRAFAAEAMAHEPGGGLGENRSLVTGDVIAVRVAYEYMARLGPMRIEPKPKAGQVNAAMVIFEHESRHAGRVEGLMSKSTRRCRAPVENFSGATNPFA
jgi:hypothetical protein